MTDKFTYGYGDPYDKHEPLVQRIAELEAENDKLKEDLDEMNEMRQKHVVNYFRCDAKLSELREAAAFHFECQELYFRMYHHGLFVDDAAERQWWLIRETAECTLRALLNKSNKGESE